MTELGLRPPLLIGGAWRTRIPSWRDVGAIILVLATLGLMGTASHQLTAPWVSARQPEISLSPAALPLYALRTTARMMLALLASLLFTFTYATLAAKSRRAETVLIPLLDVLQSVRALLRARRSHGRDAADRLPRSVDRP
jgi:NitT/TauT family transport system permease protein